jgi:hypothetical protein
MQLGETPHDIMKRSERFLMKARRTALWAVAILCGSFAGCVWSVAATQPVASGGVLAGVLAAIGLFYGGALMQEAWRLLRVSQREALWEWRSEVRPRL